MHTLVQFNLSICWKRYKINELKLVNHKNKQEITLFMSFKYRFTKEQ